MLMITLNAPVRNPGGVGEGKNSHMGGILKDYLGAIFFGVTAQAGTAFPPVKTAKRALEADFFVAFGLRRHIATPLNFLNRILLFYSSAAQCFILEQAKILLDGA
ncbi:hypothetical protein IT084_11605 [Desulfallas sp. Bu1-1]|uniref:hypothetical protein n=1 Tax=Desulfallas sp. Bu1-1 TaxID=2787620 RepID=UPI00189E8490|nr:hypothetical protein [Desulfallas sp. Bu1-1]MBF7083619.1 hypothetical protein [Desulfallas sp. Bu1-1]